MDMARERISVILEMMTMFLSFQMIFSLITAAVVCILDSTSGLDSTSVWDIHPETAFGSLLSQHVGSERLQPAFSDVEVRNTDCHICWFGAMKTV